MPNPQYNKFLKQIRDNDPTRENGFMANILETPKAKEERLRAHRFLPRRMPEGKGATGGSGSGKCSAS